MKVTFNSIEYEVSEELVDAAQQYIAAVSLSAEAIKLDLLHKDPSGHKQRLDTTKEQAYALIKTEVEGGGQWDKTTKNKFLIEVNNTALRNILTN